jgi:hypothetical protein
MSVMGINFADSSFLMIPAAAAALLVLIWWFRRQRGRPVDTAMAEDRVDTLIGWPPEATRILRTSERLAYSTLKLALPGYMILAQVPVARFINVPKRNSYAEWVRRLGSQCVDFVVCDVTSQVVAVIDVRAAESAFSDRLRRRLDRLARILKAVSIPLHVWEENALPSVEAARTQILPHAPAVPAAIASRRAAAAASPVARQPSPPSVFEDTDRIEADGYMEVIEMPEPSSSTWFDELDSESSKLPPRTPRTGH